MTGQHNKQLQVTPGQDIGGQLPSLDLQHLWFQTVRTRTWTTLAIVPVEDSLSVMGIAVAMGQMATQQPKNRVLVVNAALKMAQDDVDFEAGTVEENLKAQVLQSPDGCKVDFVDFSTLTQSAAQRALTLAPQLLDYLSHQGHEYDTAIFGVDSLILHTRAIPLVRSIDAVVLAVTLGKTTFADTRRLIDIVGREKVLGAVAVHPSR